MPVLRQVTDDKELEDLREKMEQYLPHSATIHGLMIVMTKTNARDGIVTKVFIPEEPESSSFVIVTPSCSEEAMQSMYVFWNTEEEDDEVILSLLKALPKWNWAAPVLFRAIPTPVSNKLQEYVRKGYFGSMWTDQVLEAYLYYLDKTDLSFDVPEGFSVSRLFPKDVPSVVDAWGPSWADTPKDLESLLTYLPSVALYDPHHRLIAFNLLYKNGFIAKTFTRPEYRRRGFGSAVTLAMAQKMRQIGLPVRSVVAITNEASKRCREKLGFERQCDLLSLILLPEGTTLKTWVKRN